MRARPRPSAAGASASQRSSAASSQQPLPAINVPAGRFAFWTQRVPVRHVLAMSEQLLTLLQAGLPLDRALHIGIGSLEHPHFRQVMQTVLLDVEKGNTLADAFGRHPAVFPRLYINMIRAGEEGGVLPVVMQRLIEFYNRSLEFRSFLITSSIYPLLLFFFGSAALLALTVFVLPKFGQIFADMNQTLPLPAAVLIAVGGFLRSYGWLLIGLTAAGLFAFVRALRDDGWRERWQRLLLRLPLLGGLLLKIQLATVCRTWGTLMSSGVPILTGMRIVRELSDNIPLQQALERLVKAVQEGRGVSAPLLADAFFPRLLGQLATVGEEAGSLDQMLVKVADQYEKDIQKATRNLVALFEPAMILLMGGLIGIIVVSMLTAIFSINDMPL